jgi:CxxC-x17-CxxC domain-containing protein
MYVIGKTGMGKTTLLENMVIDDIRSGRGVAVVDPHGEFAEKLLDFVPRERIDDVIYFNPADLEYPIAFNVIENVAPEYRHLVTDGLVGVFYKLWAESWGPRLEYVLRNAILSLLEIPDSTLLGILRILTDKEYRKWVVDQLKDPVVKAFWTQEFIKYPDRFQAEAVAPIQNKVGQFLANPLIRNIVGQTRTAFDLREAMDSSKIIILNLSKGRIGEGTSRLLGAMMITKMQLAAMSRIDMPEEDRKDFYLYVDEFQNFATTSFANILSEARKYRLNLILAHQYIAQLESENNTVVRDAVFGNVGTIVVFRVGGADAEFLEREFAPEFTANDLVNLAKYHIYLKLMIDGVSSKAFSATTLPPYEPPPQSFREEIIALSRARYGSKREEVEERIAAWAGPIEPPASAEAVGPSGKPRKERPMFDATCWVCGTATRVPFEPDNRRPIYCEKCLQEIRAGKREPLRQGTPPPKGLGEKREGHHDRVASLPPSEKPLSLSELPSRSDVLPPREKEKRQSKDRPAPDLSGLREILSELDEAVEEESVEDIMGK